MAARAYSVGRNTVPCHMGDSGFLVEAMSVIVGPQGSLVARSLIVDTFAPNIGVSRFPQHRFAAVRFLYRSLCVLGFACLLGGAAVAAEVRSAPAASFGPYQSFSVADFDGDSKPDLASVQYGTSDSTRAAYTIQLQLSTAGSQFFQITAPIGGLQVVSRDVNGDNALDLVLTTTWLRQPVAILLNDGHGSFTCVDPDAFAKAFSELGTTWSSTTDNATDATGIPPQSRKNICSKIKFFLHHWSQLGSIAFSESRLSHAPLLLSNSPRAPPLEFPQL